MLFVLLKEAFLHKVAKCFLRGAVGCNWAEEGSCGKRLENCFYRCKTSNWKMLSKMQNFYVIVCLLLCLKFAIYSKNFISIHLIQRHINCICGLCFEFHVLYVPYFSHHCNSSYQCCKIFMYSSRHILCLGVLLRIY